MSIRLLRNPFKRRTVANSAPLTVADDVRILRLVKDELHASFLQERAALMAKVEQAQKSHAPTADLMKRLRAVNHKLMKFEQGGR